MPDADLSQAEANALLAMRKVTATKHTYDVGMPGEKLAIPLVSEDEREQFVLDLGRGRIEMQRAKYQNRARQTVVLARVDLNGAPHRNPDGQEIECPHLHLYKEGYGHKWAVALPQDTFSAPDDLWQTLEDFMRFCNIVSPPNFKRGVLA